MFIGIFLALVFEAPVRYLMAKTGMSRGLAASGRPRHGRRGARAGAAPPGPLVGSVRDYLQDLPPTVEQLRESDELSSSATVAQPRTFRRIRRGLVVGAGRDLAVLGFAGDLFSGFLIAFTITFICIFLLSDIANLKRALGSVLSLERTTAGSACGSE